MTSNQPAEFAIGDLKVGASSAPIFFAEVGSYFNGDASSALRLFEKIVAVRDAVPEAAVALKTEILDNPEICLRADLTETYVDKAGNARTENYRELLERKSMPLDDYRPLFAYCREQNIPTVVSVYDFNAADFSEEQGAAALKIASANIVHLPLIDHVARKGLPMVIDSGRATLQEVARAIECARSAGCSEIVVQHSPDGHPALPAAHNLRILQSYAQAFGLPTGLSDHYVGVEMLYMAVALGSQVLEKGLYFDPDELDQDISHSMSIDDFEFVLRRVMDCWTALGSTYRDTSKPILGNIGSSQRQGLVAKVDLKPGDAVAFENVRFAFPAFGVGVEHWFTVQDWVMKRPVAAGKPIGWGDVEPK
jgi:sialic acid synthase SpsE